MLISGKGYLIWRPPFIGYLTVPLLILLLSCSLQGQFYSTLTLPSQTSPCIDFPVEITLTNDEGEVVSGTAKVKNGKKSFLLTENQSTYIPIGEIHSLENPGKSIGHPPYHHFPLPTDNNHTCRATHCSTNGISI